MLKDRRGRHKSDLAFFAAGFLFSIFYLILNLSYAQETPGYDDSGKRNPFIPLVTSDGRLLRLENNESVGGLELEGIIYDKNGLSYAIVNSEVVKVGDSSGDYRVLKIQKDKVIFIKDGETLEIDLKKEEE